MRGPASHWLILLAVLLTASQATLASHFAVHSENEVLQCVLCIGQADSKSLAQDAELYPDLPTGTGHFFGESLTCFVIHKIYQPYHSRAPPHSVGIVF